MKEKTNLKALFAVLFMLSTLVTSTVIVVHAQGAEDEEPTPEEAEVAQPGIDAAISDAELSDLQAVASQSGMSLQEAIDRRLLYGLLGLLLVAVAVTELLVLVAWLRGLVVRRREASGAAG